ncbi:MAG: hypothetical protein AAF799_21220 [Myxococcota bacterium]
MPSSTSKPVPRWLRTLPWLTGLVVGATAHIVWFSQAQDAPVVHIVQVPAPPAPVVHVHVHSNPIRGLPTPRPEAAPTKTRAPEAKGAVVCTDAGCSISRVFLRRLLTESEFRREHMRLVPSRRHGEPIGFRVFGMYPGCVADLLGLRVSDTITAVDGISLADPPHPDRILARLHTADDFTLTVDRLGTPIELRYVISDEA